MSRFAIVVTDGRTGNMLELCRVGTNPEPVAKGARRKTYKLGKRVLRLYSNVEVVEIGAVMTTPAMLTVFEGRELRGFILPRAKKIPNGKA